MAEIAKVWNGKKVYLEGRDYPREESNVADIKKPKKYIVKDGMLMTSLIPERIEEHLNEMAEKGYRLMESKINRHLVFELRDDSNG